jgi:hypothetical protein
MGPRTTTAAAAAIGAILALREASAFSTPAHHSPPRSAAHMSSRSSAFAASSTSGTSNTVRRMVTETGEQEMFATSSLLTPEGYGFSSSVERILKTSQRNNGYYRAQGSDRVIDVMGGIANQDGADIALVFDDDEGDLLGIFTETDYIKVREDSVGPGFVVIICFHPTIVCLHTFGMNIPFCSYCKILKSYLK